MANRTTWQSWSPVLSCLSCRCERELPAREVSVAQALADAHGAASSYSSMIGSYSSLIAAGLTRGGMFQGLQAAGRDTRMDRWRTARCRLRAA